MPVRHVIDKNRDLVLTIYHGDLTDDDVRDHLRDLRANPLYHDMMHELVDLRDVTDTSVSTATLSASARSQLHAPSARRAVIAPTDLLFGLSRMYQTHLGEVGASQLGVFRELQPALAWLGLSDESELPRWTTPD